MERVSGTASQSHAGKRSSWAVANARISTHTTHIHTDAGCTPSYYAQLARWCNTTDSSTICPYPYDPCHIPTFLYLVASLQYQYTSSQSHPSNHDPSVHLSIEQIHIDHHSHSPLNRNTSRCSTFEPFAWPSLPPHTHHHNHLLVLEWQHKLLASMSPRYWRRSRSRPPTCCACTSSARARDRKSTRLNSSH